MRIGKESTWVADENPHRELNNRILKYCIGILSCFSRKKYLFLTLFSWAMMTPATGFAYSIEELPIQDGGRVKPYLSFAQETLQLIYGRSKFEGQSATRIVTTWLLLPEIWLDKDIVLIDHHGLKETLGFDKTKKRFSPKELMNHQRLNTLFSDVASRLSRKEKLDPYYQAIQRLEFQLMTFLGLQKGGLSVFPTDVPERNNAWLRVSELDEAKKEQFFQILSFYSQTFASESQEKMVEAEGQLAGALKDFTSQAKVVGQENYPSKKEMKVEVHYQVLKPFFWTWVLYLIAAVLVGMSYLFLAKVFFGLGVVAFVMAFVMHTYGFALRVMITGRPPVSNMYESVIWVAWGTILFAGVFYFFRKKKYIVVAGSVVAAVCLIVADRAPVILSPTLQPLEPVLRSNMWLIIHVMTITLSYAAFFLAMGVGDYGLGLTILNKAKYRGKIRELSQTCYHLIQVGVVLLAAGTILGGVWADYSWGRFWGWDPKETWAFIALMGYLALLHAKLQGWVKDVGILAGSVLAFSLVVMAWYGVNYVLGTGLHSYGFGAGGLEYVTAFVGFHGFFTLFALSSSRAAAK